MQHAPLLPHEFSACRARLSAGRGCAALLGGAAKGAMAIPRRAAPPAMQRQPSGRQLDVGTDTVRGRLGTRRFAASVPPRGGNGAVRAAFACEHPTALAWWHGCVDAAAVAARCRARGVRHQRRRGRPFGSAPSPQASPRQHAPSGILLHHQGVMHVCCVPRAVLVDADAACTARPAALLASCTALARQCSTRRQSPRPEAAALCALQPVQAFGCAAGVRRGALLLDESRVGAWRARACESKASTTLTACLDACKRRRVQASVCVLARQVARCHGRAPGRAATCCAMPLCHSLALAPALHSHSVTTCAEADTISG